MKRILMMVGTVALASAAHAKEPTDVNGFRFTGTAAFITSDSTLPLTKAITSATSILTETNKTEIYLARIDCSVDCLITAQPHITTPTVPTSNSTLVRAGQPETFLIEANTNLGIKTKGVTSGEINITKLKP